MVEPYLLKLGFIARTPSGRKATEAAYKHLGLVREAGQFALRFDFD
jgi:Holliday junction DNA helicase RuvB